jgi:elongation factor G
MAYTTQGIRNVGLVGQAGTGKTLLLESLLLEAGAIRSKGSLQRGTTVSDCDEQERRLQHSLDTAICGFDRGKTHVNIIDTPGYPDFLGRTYSVLEAVETAAVVVSATNGMDTVTQRLMDFAEDRQLCRLVIINKIDCRDAKPADVLQQVRETFGAHCLPLNLPADSGTAVVDCFFQASGRATDFSTVEAAHTQIIDQVIELDERLMALYLEQGEDISPEQLHDPFEQALREGHLVPVCFVSAETGVGVPELLNIFERLMPNPTEGNPPPFLKGPLGDGMQRVEVAPDPDKHVIAHVFKIAIDPYVGKLGLMRVHQGTIRQGSQLFVGDARKPVRVAHLWRLMGKETVEMTAAIPGDLCALRRPCSGLPSSPSGAVTSSGLQIPSTSSPPRIRVSGSNITRLSTRRSCMEWASCT